MSKATNATKKADLNEGSENNEARPGAAARGVFLVSAPAGPRRRAGFGFGPAVTELTLAEISEVGDPEKIVGAWRADPYLKVDFREAERSTED